MPSCSPAPPARRLVETSKLVSANASSSSRPAPLCGAHLSHRDCTLVSTAGPARCPGTLTLGRRSQLQPRLRVASFQGQLCFLGFSSMSSFPFYARTGNSSGEGQDESCGRGQARGRQAGIPTPPSSRLLGLPVPLPVLGADVPPFPPTPGVTDTRCQSECPLFHLFNATPCELEARAPGAPRQRGTRSLHRVSPALADPGASRPARPQPRVCAAGGGGASRDSSLS